MSNDSVQLNVKEHEVSPEARLALVNQFAAELSKNFRNLDKDRNQVLSPLELVLATENEKLPTSVRDACRYFDQIHTGRYWNQSQVDRIGQLTSPDPNSKDLFIAREHSSLVKFSVGTAAFLTPMLGGLGYLAGRMRGGLFGAASGLAVAGGAYLGGRYFCSSEWDQTRTSFGSNSNGDEVMRPYLRK